MKVILLHTVLQCILSATFVYAEDQRHLITRNDMVSGKVDDYVSEMTTAGMNLVEYLDEVKDECRPNEFHPGTLVDIVENVEYYEDCAVICRSMVDTCFVVTYAKLTQTCLMAREMATRRETFKEVTSEYCEIGKITVIPEPSDNGVQEPAHGQAYVGCGQPTWPFELTPTTPARRKRILGGGRPTNHYSLPWMVDVENWKGDHVCGGTLINDGRNLEESTAAHVLTAAHCVIVPDNVTNEVEIPEVGRLIIYARAGSVDRRFTEAHEQRLLVRRAIIHGQLQWYKRNLEYDIAILEVAGLYQFNDYVRPICLPEPNMSLSIGQTCYVAGSGREEANVSSKYLKAAVVSVSGFLYDGRMPVVIKTTSDCGSHQCGGIAMNGDSGSPLFLFVPVRQAYVLVGVHSQSGWFPLERTYDVKQVENQAMDVHYFRDWIIKAMKSEAYWLEIHAHSFYL